MLSLKGKVAIVTGAGSVGPGWGNGHGHGRGLAEQLRAGVNVRDIFQYTRQKSLSLKG